MNQLNLQKILIMILKSQKNNKMKSLKNEFKTIPFINHEQFKKKYEKEGYICLIEKKL